MATRRKYAPAKYRDGGRVPIEDISIPGDEPSSTTELRVATTPNPATKEDENPLQRAVDAQTRAEELQRAPSQLDQHLAGLPISDHQRAFLRAHPEFLFDEFRSRAMAASYRDALDEGIEDDTEAMNQRILDGVQREIAYLHQVATDNIRSRAYPAPAAEPEEPVAAPEPPAPAPARMPAPARRSMPVSAPVSRDIPMASGQRQHSNSVTLSAEERDMAHRSFTDPNMSDAQKELLYARNKQKLQRMRANGEYPQSERN